MDFQQYFTMVIETIKWVILKSNRVLPFYEEYRVRLLRILTDRGTEYCGAREYHKYQLYLALEDIDQSRIKARGPRTNDICERLNRTIPDEFYAIVFRKKIYATLETITIKN